MESCSYTIVKCLLQFPCNQLYPRRLLDCPIVNGIHRTVLLVPLNATEQSCRCGHVLDSLAAQTTERTGSFEQVERWALQSLRGTMAPHSRGWGVGGGGGGGEVDGWIAHKTLAHKTRTYTE